MQALTIAILVGCGIASVVSAVAAAASMGASRDAFYAAARLGQVFDHLRRAPRTVLDRLRDLPGVAVADGRVVDDFRVEVEGSMEPVTMRFVSLGWPEQDRLNRAIVLAGRPVDRGSTDEIVLSAAFAEAWNLQPGAQLTAVINERRATLRVVGVATAPDFSFVLAPHTGLPDPRHFGVAWMDEEALSKAAGLVGAFNDVTLQLATGADEAETLKRVDQVLEPYGGLGAVGRADQPAAKIVEQKIGQLGKMARSLPAIFLGVAAFLLNVLLSRVVGTQREQIATLKALGYRTRELLVHYLEFAVVICAAGAVLGGALGLLAAEGLLHVFAGYFKFPVFIRRLDATSIVVAIAVSFAAGVGGALLGVHKAVSVPPAEAMRPEAPPAYRATVLDRVYRLFSPMVRMILRDSMRRPSRLALSAGSVALATALVVAGSGFKDSINEVLRLQFEVSHRESVIVTLDEPKPWRAVREAEHVPGVVKAEGERVVPVRLRAGPRFRTTSILGMSPDVDLHRALDVNRHGLQLPPGLSLSRVLAGWLDVRAGEPLDVEVLEGDRRTRRVTVAALVDDLVGVSAYMNAPELSRLLGEEARVDSLLLAVDPHELDAVTLKMNAMPAAASVSRPDLDRSLVRAEVADEFNVMSVLMAVLASAIAVGVVYNNARIALEVRSRDLATMRILGFTRGELATILLGEQAVQLIGIVPGLALGRALAGLWMSSVDKELMRVPLTLAPASYVGAVCVVAFAAFASALVVRRQSDGLDLVAVLKARD
jgi:putative ABC transport system permease protein